MSMPSSRLEVATTAGSRPDFNASSICFRSSRETLPWCARATTAGAPVAAADCAMIAAGIPAAPLPRARAGGSPVSAPPRVSRSAFPQMPFPVRPEPAPPSAGPRPRVKCRSSTASGVSPGGLPEGSPCSVVPPKSWFDPEADSAERWSRRASSARSADNSLSRAHNRSEPRRELVKTIVDRWASIRSSTRSSTAGQIDGVCRPPSRSSSAGDSSSRVMSSTGTWTVTSMVLALGGRTISTCCEPPRNRAVSSIGRTVADSPIRCAGRSSSASSRSRESAR